MSKNHYSLQYPAETFGADVMGTVDPFSESQRSKSQEHEDRLLQTEKLQKITKTQEIES